MLRSSTPGVVSNNKFCLVGGGGYFLISFIVFAEINTKISTK